MFKEIQDGIICVCKYQETMKYNRADLKKTAVTLINEKCNCWK